MQASETEHLGAFAEWLGELRDKTSDELVAAVVLSLTVIDEATRRYTELALAFNGGKDCTVLAHLLYVYTRFKPQHDLAKLRSLFFPTDRSFPEVATFVHQFSAQYGLTVHEVQKPLKHALAEEVNETHIRGVFLGTRSTDPAGDRQQLKHFTPTDKGWAPVMRIMPVLHWRYGLVWEYLRALAVPYCSLYDHGYTSIGEKTDTLPNPLLLREDGTYDPAHLLLQEDAERVGRVRVVRK